MGERGRERVGGVRSERWGEWVWGREGRLSGCGGE